MVRRDLILGAGAALLFPAASEGQTLDAGTLKIVSAYPDPPFERMAGGKPTGFDIDLMRAIGKALRLRCKFDRYAGSDFNGIFGGLGTRYDVVISGTTITSDRERVARFSSPYAVFNQGVAISRVRSPNVRSVAGLHGAAVGIQVGNTSDAVARRWLARGSIARIAYYPYNAIETALADLTTGKITAIVKLSPVLHALIANRPELAVAFEVPTHERIAIATAPDAAALMARIDDALDTLKNDGTLAELRARWFSFSGSKG